jgi:uncharacterized Zn finger protein
VTRLVCPHCGEWQRYQMLNLSTNSVRYKCHKCGQVHEWERTPDGWRVKPEPERSWEQ